ncbi:MAG: DUF167 domain-containing protein [Chloroflexota bacterium]|nr:DUF167 domain-containing protein [Chloroflexota bacterium]
MGAAGAYDDLALTPAPDGVMIPVRALPRAGRNAVGGVTEGALRVRLTAPPVEGAANRALIAFLAGVLGVPARDLTIAGGERGRRKLVHVRSLTPDEARRRLAARR